MTKDGKHAKWQNGVQNHQNGDLLPVLDPQIKGYKPVELQNIPRQMWEINLRVLSSSYKKCMEKKNICFSRKRARGLKSKHSLQT
eukprot:4543588-Ditylum_brightwellii.AAC.1